MRISCIQMDMEFACPEKNYKKAATLIKQAAANNPDVIVLPELWNIGFFPKPLDKSLCDENGEITSKFMGDIAKKYSVTVISGSVSDIRNGKIYNTAYVFDRTGKAISSYDKIHLFSPMDENLYFQNGEALCMFGSNGVKCGIEICYDIRFPELSRAMSVKGLDILFLPAQWPEERITQLQTLIKARAIENRIYVVCCNSCGKAPLTQFGGNSAIIAPTGEAAVTAGRSEEIITADIDIDELRRIKKASSVFNDRLPCLYERFFSDGR